MSKPKPEAAPRPERTTVALVLDPDFGERLDALVERMPAWALNSPTNRNAAEYIWGQRPEARRRITLFDVPEYPLDTQEFIGVLASMDSERAKHSQPPMRDVEVIGMEIYPDLNGALLEFGFESVETTVSGFKAIGLKRA